MGFQTPFAGWQVLLLRYVTPPSALLSIFGSWLICQNLLGRWKNGWTGQQPNKAPLGCYERMMLGLSAYDIMTSTRMTISAIFWLPHRVSSPTCTTDGFLVTLGFSGPFYNAAISLYFLIVICSRQKEKRISWRTECTLHLISIGFPLASALAGLWLKVYNPEAADIGCWAEKYPMGCTGDDCIRGHFAAAFSYGVGFFPLLLVWIVLIGSNLAIYFHVRCLIRKTLRYTQPAQARLAVPSSTEKSDTSQGASKPDGASFQTEKTRIQSVTKTRMVANQNLLYVGAFFLCFIWSGVLQIAISVDPEGFQAGKYFFFNVLQGIFYPSQGLFNALVFFRPNYMRIRSSVEGRNISRWQCMQFALFPRSTSSATQQTPDLA
jgi:hypothetical protein